MIQSASCWDILVWPNGLRCYRMRHENLSPEVQIHAVMSPDYHNEVWIMREQVEKWRESMGTHVPRGVHTPVIQTHPRNLVINAPAEPPQGITQHLISDALPKGYDPAVDGGFE